MAVIGILEVLGSNAPCLHFSQQIRLLEEITKHFPFPQIFSCLHGLFQGTPPLRTTPVVTPILHPGYSSYAQPSPYFRGQGVFPHAQAFSRVMDVLIPLNGAGKLS